jgi:hypothetical protein
MSQTTPAMPADAPPEPTVTTPSPFGEYAAAFI